MTLQLEKILWIREGEGAAASGRVPQDELFFQDHFPEFPVLPGVLSLEILKKTAEAYLREFEPGKKYAVREIRNAKFSSYLKPGDTWESQAKVVSQTHEETHWDLRLLHQNKAAASARMILREKK